MNHREPMELSCIPAALGELHAAITAAIERVDGRIEVATRPHMAERWSEIRNGLTEAREQIERQYTDGILPMSHDCATEVCQGMPLDRLEGADWTDRWPCAEWDEKSGKWILEFVLEGTEREVEDYRLRPVRIFDDGTVEAMLPEDYRDGCIDYDFDVLGHNAAIKAGKAGAK